MFRRRSLIVVQEADPTDGAAAPFIPLRLAYALSAGNERVTVIDTASGNGLAQWLAVSRAALSTLDANGQTFASCILRGFPLTHALRDLTHRRSWIPAGFEIAQLEECVNAEGELGVALLAARLDELRCSKDYVIVNCSAGLSPTALAAIWRANVIVIQMLRTAMSRERVQKIMRDINRVKKVVGAVLPCRAWILPIIVRGERAPDAVATIAHAPSHPVTVEVADAALVGHQEPFPFNAEPAVSALALKVLKAAAQS